MCTGEPVVDFEYGRDVFLYALFIFLFSYFYDTLLEDDFVVGKSKARLDFFPDQPRVNFCRFLAFPPKFFSRYIFFREITLFSVVCVQSAYHVHPGNRA